MNTKVLERICEANPGYGRAICQSILAHQTGNQYIASKIEATAKGRVISKGFDPVYTHLLTALELLICKP